MPENFDVEAARKAGYSDDEILSHLTSTRKFDVDGAVKAGYSKPDIIVHLSSAAPAAAEPAKPKGLMDHASDLVSHWWDQVNPVNAIKGAGNAILHPINTVKAIGAENDKTEADIDAAVKSGNKKEATALMLRRLLNVIPGVGTTVDEGAKKIAAGEYGAGAGDILGLGTAMLAPGAIAEHLPAAVRVTPKASTALNTVEKAGVEFGEARGVPIDAATQTGNKFVQSAQEISSKQPLGAPIAERFRGRQAQNLARVSGELADEAHPAPVSPESAGRGVSGALDKGIKTLDAAGDKHYEAFRAAEADPANLQTVQMGTKQVPELNVQGNPIPGKFKTVPVTEDIPLPVDMRRIKEALEPVYDSMKQWMEPAKRSSSAGFQAIESILKGKDYLPASIAEKGLGGLKELARGADSAELRNVSQGIGANATGLLQDAIDTAVGQQAPDALKALQKGRAATASKMEIADVAKQLRDEPVQTFNKLVWQKDTGIDMLREVAKHAPAEMPKVGRAFIEQLFDKATENGGFDKAKSLMNQWQNLGPETKKILYPNPMLRTNIDKFFTLATKVAENPNPSGSAIVAHSMGAIPAFFVSPAAGGTYLLGGAAMAKLMFSPRGVRLLTEGLKVPVSPAASAITAVEVLKMAGDDAQKVPDNVIPFPSPAPLQQTGTQ